MMLLMRSTVRIDDELLGGLRARAQKDGVSLTRALNDVLRSGLRSTATRTRPRKTYREKPLGLGEARVDLSKALAAADGLEGAEIARKLALRK
jgi:hypothetical protein